MKHSRIVLALGAVLFSLVLSSCEMQESDYRIHVEATLSSRSGMVLAALPVRLCLELAYLEEAGANSPPRSAKSSHCEETKTDETGGFKIDFTGRLADRPPFTAAVPVLGAHPISLTARLEALGKSYALPLDLYQMKEIDSFDGSKVQATYKIHYRLN